MVCQTKKSGIEKSNEISVSLLLNRQIQTAFQLQKSHFVLQMRLLGLQFSIGFFDIEEFHFEVYEGKGGHLPGEIVLIDYSKHIAITGDIYINTRPYSRAGRIQSVCTDPYDFC